MLGGVQFPISEYKFGVTSLFPKKCKIVHGYIFFSK